MLFDVHMEDKMIEHHGPKSLPPTIVFFLQGHLKKHYKPEQIPDQKSL